MVLDNTSSGLIFMKMYLFLRILICLFMLECVPVICGELGPMVLHIYWNKNQKRIMEFPRFFIFCTFNTEPRLTCNSPVFKISSKQRNVQTTNRHASTENQQNYFVISHSYCHALIKIVSESPCVRNLLYDNCDF